MRDSDPGMGPLSSLVGAVELQHVSRHLRSRAVRSEA
jgi:hypothetical protein